MSAASPRRPPSLQSPFWRLALFTLLYGYQGLVAGFALTALANHFAAAGSSTTEVGRHLAIVGLPWVLQPLLWGPLIDRAAPFRMGPRRFWLVLALGCAQVALTGLLLLGPSPGLTAVSGVLLLHSLAASLADTATDRMIAGAVPADELGRTSAGTRAGFVIGNAVGAALFAWILAGASVPVAAGLLLGLTTPLALVALLVREAPEDRFLSLARDASAPRPGLLPETVAFARQLLTAFRARDAAILLAICFTIDFALNLFQVPFGVALVQEHGWDATALSRLQAGLALLGLTTPLALAAVLVREAPEDRLLSLARAPSPPRPGLLPETITFARQLLAAFRGRDAATLLAICFAIDFALNLFQVPFGVALVQEHGWDATALSRLQAGLALLGGTLGAAGIGAAVDRAGPGRALRILFLACAAAFGGAGALIAAGLTATAGPVILGLASVVPALLYVALLPAVLLASREGRASATQFQIYMAAMNGGDVAGAALAGALSSALAPTAVAFGVAGVFLFCARLRAGG
jgi:MFS family permease